MPAAPAPLTDAEITELDDLLAAVPEPLEPLDAVMLDGYLCGVLAQPVVVDPAAWLPPIFDWRLGDLDAPDAGTELTPDTPGWHAAKHERVGRGGVSSALQRGGAGASMWRYAPGD